MSSLLGSERGDGHLDRLIDSMIDDPRRLTDQIPPMPLGHHDESHAQ
ncbi:MAG: hypothetical protein QM796_03050 [Chthoniobacteraceae bacterium]